MYTIEHMAILYGLYLGLISPTVYIINNRNAIAVAKEQVTHRLYNREQSSVDSVIT